jgi:tetrahydromethanopterin S-methyltransferase subunit E
MGLGDAEEEGMRAWLDSVEGLGWSMAFGGFCLGFCVGGCVFAGVWYGVPFAVIGMVAGGFRLRIVEALRRKG